MYDIGFGSYVIDACQSTSALNLSVTCDYEISSAGIKDVDELLAFANLSNDYYAASPVFLKRNEYSAAEITEFLKDGYILTARDKGRIIGVMSFSLDPGYHFEHLTAADSSSIKFIGAFIHSDYRGRGIGTALLEKVFAICREKRKSYLHVSFETANPDAIHFWRNILNRRSIPSEEQLIKIYKYFFVTKVCFPQSNCIKEEEFYE